MLKGPPTIDPRPSLGESEEPSCAHRDEGGVASHEHDAIRINIGHLIAFWVVLDVDIGREERGECPGKPEQHEDEQHEEIKDILDHAAHHADLQSTRMVGGTCCPFETDLLSVNI